MKQNFKLKLSAIIFAGVFCAHNVQAQTYGSGNVGNSCGTLAGALGTTNTMIGCGAGTAINANGIDNSFLGDNAGRNNTYAKDNVALGLKALYTQSYANGNTAWSTFNTAVGNYALYTNNPVQATDSGMYNTAVGYYAGKQNTTGWRNSYLGYYAGYSSQRGSHNSMVGFEAGRNNSGHYNTMMGYRAGAYHTTSSTGFDANSYYGKRAGEGDLNGAKNTFIGDHSGLIPAVNGSGTYNTAIGSSSAYNISSGSFNLFAGSHAGYTNTTGSNNTFAGDSSGYSNTTASANTFLGYRAGRKNTAGGAQGATAPNVFVGADAGYSNVTGNANTFTGHKSGYLNTASENTFYGFSSGYTNSSGTINVFIGYEAGYANTFAGRNVAMGYHALKTQSYGSTAWNSYNTAIGNFALFSNQPTSTSNGYYNTALGYQAGYNNTTATNNTFIGMQSGINNTTGAYNTYMGSLSAYHQNTGSSNTVIGYQAGYIPGSTNYAYDNNSFVGYQAGYSNQTGDNNTALGYQAGFTITAGDSNTFVGRSADANSGTLTNCAAFGFGALATASRTMMFGNSKVTGLYTTAGIFATSDGRFKINVKEEVKGLEFIKKLRPVTYQIDTKALDGFIKQNMPQPTDSSGNPISNSPPAGDFSASTNKVHSGFIAQEVEQAATEVGFISSIVSTPSNSNDPYAINYAEIVVPLVKAVQEQQKMIDSLKSQIATLKGAGQLTNNNDQGKGESNYQIDLATANVILYDAEPNPFTSSTIIRFFIPENISGSAYIIFNDMYGKEVNKLEVKERGFGKVEATTENLAAGIYSYSIVVNEKMIDAKKMIRTK